MERAPLVVVAASPFGRALLFGGLIAWLFLHGVAYGLARGSDFTPVSGASSVWVVGMTLAIVAADIKRRRMAGLFAALGLSKTALWGSVAAALVLLEALLRVVLSVAGGS